jgi:hypothetical protein
MKKLVTLLTASVIGLGITSVAAAQPSIDIDARASLDIKFGTYPRPEPRPYHHVVQHSGWWYKLPGLAPVVGPKLAAPVGTWLSLGTVSTGTQTLKLDKFTARNFDTLQLDVHGKVDLRRVVITFANRQEQTVTFNERLTERSPMATISLAGMNRGIAKITFYSAASTKGSISVRGRDDARRSTAAALKGFTRLGTVSTGRQSIEKIANAKYETLGLTIKGRVHLERVIIEYGNGDRQAIAFDATFTAKSPAPMIDLAAQNRRIVSVTIVSDVTAGGEIAIHAK